MKKIILMIGISLLLISCGSTASKLLKKQRKEKYRLIEKKIRIEKIVKKISVSDSVKFIEETYHKIILIKNPRVFDILKIEDKFYIGHVSNNEHKNSAKVTAKTHVRQYLAKITLRNQEQYPSYEGEHMGSHDYYYIFRLTRDEYKKIMKKD